MNDERLRMVAEAKTLIPMRDTLDKYIPLFLILHAGNLARLPKTDVLNDLSAREPELLHNVLIDDKDLGEMRWELYQIQKKMRAYYDFAEEFIAFWEEHFHLRKEQEDEWEKIRIEITDGRAFIRNMGRGLVRDLSEHHSLAEGGF